MASGSAASKVFVVKLGGSFMLADGKANMKEFVEIGALVREVAAAGHRLVVVVGGGPTARTYIQAAEHLGANNGVKDQFGILVSRLNARLFIEALGDLSFAEPPESLPQVKRALQVRPVVVLGGLQPGQSTTAVSALCAEFTNAARCVFSTDVDGVYTADPRKDKGARLLAKVSYKELDRLTGSSENAAPGQYRLMDGMALTILERSRIPAVIIRGTADNIRRALLTDDPVGTVIEADARL